MLEGRNTSSRCFYFDFWNTLPNPKVDFAHSNEQKDMLKACLRIDQWSFLHLGLKPLATTKWSVLKKKEHPHSRISSQSCHLFRIRIWRSNSDDSIVLNCSASIFSGAWPYAQIWRKEARKMLIPYHAIFDTKPSEIRFVSIVVILFSNVLAPGSRYEGLFSELSPLQLWILRRK